jgi:hypothetical protein
MEAEEMKRIFIGALIISISGCLSFSGVSTKPVPITEKSEEQKDAEAPAYLTEHHQDNYETEPVPQPVTVKRTAISNPCANISDENIYQEIRLKLTCMEENYK